MNSESSSFSNSSDPKHQENAPVATSQQLADIDPQQIFLLIDRLIPYSACFYHQILPLKLNGYSLTVGMVNPDDHSALDFVVSILEATDSPVKVHPLALDEDSIQAILSAYWNYSHSSEKEGTSSTGSKSPKMEDISTLILQNESKSEENNTSSDLQVVRKSLSKITSTSSQSPFDFLRPLNNIEARYLSDTVETLVNLSPQELLLELLARVLVGGIGRLFFERQQEYGRILWSQNGILQSSLEEIPLLTFQSLLDQLKQMVRLPVMPVAKTKKMEIAQRYQEQPVLLRLQFIPGEKGESATLQVLRGQALQFYQQQQMNKLTQEAVQLGRHLERKVKQIKVRTYFNPTPTESLPTLRNLLINLLKQLDDIES